MDIRTLWTDIQKRSVHIRIVVAVFLGLGITNLVFGSFWGIAALLFFISGSSKTSGAGAFFGGFLMLVLSVPLVFMSLLYLFGSFGIIRRKTAARYGSMALCFLLTPFAWDLAYTVSPRYSVELNETVFGLSMYLVWALIWKWEPDRSYNLSLL
jgi:hypothetical protein